MRPLLALPLGLLLACTESDPAGTDTDATDTSDTSQTTGASDTDGTSGTTTDGTTSDATTSTTSASTTDGTTTGSGPTPGCGMAATPGQTDRNIDVDGMNREYKLVVPDGYDPNTAYPVVFAWHARGTSAGLARAYYKVEEAANDAAVFVYPEGLPIASQGGQTGWDLTGNGIDIAFFDAMANELVGELCLDVDRIYSTGHSFGAFMSQSLACYRGEYIRAIGGVAGGGPYTPCDNQVAAWIAHGMSDATVPYSEGENSRDFWQTQNDCADTTTPGDPSQCVNYDGCAEGYPLTWCSHNEPDLGGHGWPLWAGPTIWTFFSQF